MQQGQETVPLLLVGVLAAAAAAEDADRLRQADTRRRRALGQLVVPLAVSTLTALLLSCSWLTLRALLLSTPVLGSCCCRR